MSAPSQYGRPLGGVAWSADSNIPALEAAQEEDDEEDILLIVAASLRDRGPWGTTPQGAGR